MPAVDLSVGHGVRPDGTYDPGASGGGTDEQQAGDRLTAACAEQLRSYDSLTVASVETYTEDPNYVGSVDRINRTMPDLAVTFHHDWAGAPEGAFCHWYADGTDAHDAADRIIQHVAQAGFAIRSWWHKARPGLYFLSQTTCPAVLVEAGRIGQHTDDDLRSFGRAAADGIAAHFGLAMTPDEEHAMPNVLPFFIRASEVGSDHPDEPRVWVAVGRTRSWLPAEVWDEMRHRNSAEFVELDDDHPFWDYPILEEISAHVHDGLAPKGHRHDGYLRRGDEVALQ